MPRNSRTSRVRRAYRQNQLARICTLPEHQFGRAFDMETVRASKAWPHDYYHFRDNGSNVLAVAHLDTVVPGSRRAPHFSATAGGPKVVSGALDDRLGAYVILKLLPALDVTCDWLLTVGEESGQSTAGLFKPDKDYNWVIEFDRGGTDVVMYQYEDDDSVRSVETAGAKVGFGSYSDIAYLEHLGVKAFNWGVGYGGNYHSVNGYAYLNDTFGMVAKYLRFHEQNAGTVMPHICDSRWRDDDGYAKYYEDDYERPFDCDFCGERGTVDACTLLCRVCKICFDCGEVQDYCTCFSGQTAEPAHETETLDDAMERIRAAKVQDVIPGQCQLWDGKTHTPLSGPALASRS